MFIKSAVYHHTCLFGGTIECHRPFQLRELSAAPVWIMSSKMQSTSNTQSSNETVGPNTALCLLERRSYRNRVIDYLTFDTK